jgi:hypothetical protein
MRSILFAGFAAGALLGPTAVEAQQPTTQPPPPTGPVSNLLSTITNMPPGWARNLDGTYRQSEAGVLCPKTFNSFAFQRFQPPEADRPDVLGTCTYTGDTGRIGTIRVRRYSGEGDKGQLAANDKALMAKDGSAPPLLLHTGTDRKTGGGRATATVARNGLLVDCSVWQAEHSVPKSDFLLYCTTLTGS